MINLIEQLKKHEGFSGCYYQCTANKQTIGYGRNVENNAFSEEEELMLGADRDFELEPMNRDEAEYLLENDVLAIERNLRRRITMSHLNSARKAVCINMSFNIGVSGFMKFKNTVKAIERGDYDTAANEMLDSKWAKQVHDRANELALQMSLGEWQ